MIQDNKLPIYLMIIQELDLKLFMKQNRMKQKKKKENSQKVEDLKY